MVKDGTNERSPLRSAPTKAYGQAAAASDRENAGIVLISMGGNKQCGLDSEESDLGADKTTEWQTFVHLIKGYIGPGCLSLPWAVSQLGIPFGVVAIFLISFWCAYNCWIIVRLKRHIENTRSPQQEGKTSAITYPDVGHWAFGKAFHDYITVCICVQQLAICTVFFSFMGENLLAVLKHLDVHFLSSHVGVMTLVFPAVMILSFIPNLKILAPIMAVATVLLMMGFAALGFIVAEEWPNRPDEGPGLNLTNAPLGLCAILYCFEGIALILPIESAMEEPHKFQRPFVWSMVVSAVVLAIVGTVCVLAFGEVTNGSVTAFLLSTYGDDTSVLFWIMVANTAVSFEVLLSYPLQLFPSVELAAIWVAHNQGRSPFSNSTNAVEKDTTSLPEPQSEYHQAWDAETSKEQNVPNSVWPLKTPTSQLNFLRFSIPGDSLALRACLVILTYVVAVVVPNIATLISLAGAVAGSSTAILIPPLLELAWIHRMEHDQATSTTTTRETELSNEVFEDELDQNSTTLTTRRKQWWMEKAVCYFLFLIGVVFFAIGTCASISDIIAVYQNTE